MTIALGRVWISSMAVAFLLTSLACSGSQAPPGPPSSASPPGSDAPPHVWICAPANSFFAQNGNFGSLYVFNGSSATANLAVHFLDDKGTNLAGVAIPGAQSGENYPGQPGNTTKTLLPAHTLIIAWRLPKFAQDLGGVMGNLGPAADQLANRSTSIRVTSDQPIFVSAEYHLTDTHPIACGRLTN